MDAEILSSPNCSRKNKFMDEFKVPIFVTGCWEKYCKMNLPFEHRKWERQNYVLVCVVYNR
jgi:hypothetical protein